MASGAIGMPVTVNERSVCLLWSAQRLPHSGLTTVDGLPFHCVYRGRWRHGAGPDFAEALVAFADAELRRGDIEVHLREGDWYAHGHHRDPAYDRVILHVVLHAEGETARTSAGQPLPTLALADYVDSAQLGQQLSHDLSWDQALLELEPCRQLLARRGPAYLGALLDRAARQRLAEKVAGLAGQIDVLGLPGAFYAGLLDALGFGGNRQLFQTLPTTLPWHDLDCYLQARSQPQRFTLAQALLIGAAGLLPSQRRRGAPLSAEDLSYLRPLEACWSRYAPAYQPVITGRINGGRPTNHPVRRLAAAAALCAYAEPDLANEVLALAHQTSPERLALAWRGLLSRLGVADAYWTHHFDFGRTLRRPHHHLIGTGRAGDIVVNLFIPYLIAAELEPEIAEAAYHCHPRLADNEITRLMATMLGASAGIVNSAARQQGLLYIYRQYCRSQACPECPLNAG